jgi:hypothetical protein
MATPGCTPYKVLLMAYLAFTIFRLLSDCLLQTALPRQFLQLVPGHPKMTASHLSCALIGAAPRRMLCPSRRHLLFCQTSGSPSNGMRGAKREARGQRLRVTRVFTIAQLKNYRDSKLIGTLGRQTLCKRTCTWGAAGSHQLAAQARGDTAAKRARKRTT